MKLPPFAYAAPGSLDEAVALKAAHGDDALFLAGGQSLVPLLALRLASPVLLVDLNDVKELEYVRDDNGRLLIGSMTRQRALEGSGELRERLPALEDALPLIGHRAIRNRGTVGGSVAHADPAAEWPTLMLLLDGAVVATSGRGTRTVDARTFFEGPFMNALAPDEILREVRINVPATGTGTAFVEFARRYGDYGLVGVGAAVALDRDERVSQARIALLGVAQTPVRATEGERQLEGERPTDAAVQAVVAACKESIDPPDDVHASAAYRVHLAGVLVRRALHSALQRAREGVA